eukprot:scaffold297979_cov35-Attheya_sp.AAC.1
MDLPMSLPTLGRKNADGDDEYNNGDETDDDSDDYYGDGNADGDDEYTNDQPTTDGTTPSPRAIPTSSPMIQPTE